MGLSVLHSTPRQRLNKQEQIPQEHQGTPVSQRLLSKAKHKLESSQQRFRNDFHSWEYCPLLHAFVHKKKDRWRGLAHEGSCPVGRGIPHAEASAVELAGALATSPRKKVEKRGNHTRPSPGITSVVPFAAVHPPRYTGTKCSIVAERLRSRHGLRLTAAIGPQWPAQDPPDTISYPLDGSWGRRGSAPYHG